MAEAVYTRYRYHTDNQLDNARRKWLPDDDFQSTDVLLMYASCGSGCQARAVLSSPARSYYTAPRPVSVESYSTAAEPAPSSARRQALAERAAKRLLPQPKSVRNKQSVVFATTGSRAHHKRSTSAAPGQPLGQSPPPQP